MSLKSRRSFPPGMFQFYVPQTGWNAPGGLTFEQVVDEIIKHRLKNPRFASQWNTDRESVANELDFFTCLRINFDPNYCTPETGAIAPGEVKKKPLAPRQWNFPQSVQAGAVVAVERAANAAAGVGVVLDWLGDSLEPVPLELAEKRAAICAVCPQNGRADFLQRLEGWAASGVKQLIRLKNDLELKTNVDDKLFHCQVCDCVIGLKIHAKLDHILAHTPERMMNEFPDFCWIKTGDAGSITQKQ